MKYRLTLFPPESIEFDFSTSLVDPQTVCHCSISGVSFDLAFPEILRYAEMLGITKFSVETLDQ